MLVKTKKDFWDFCSICANIRQLTSDERRAKMNDLTAANINEPYSIALLAIGVLLPNRLGSDLQTLFMAIEKDLPND